jgi:hypothetical protein
LIRQNQNRKRKSVCASKLREAQILIIDARYLAGLVEVAVDSIETPTDLAISAAAYVAIEKLNEAMNLLDQAQAGGALDDRPPVSACSNNACRSRLAFLSGGQSEEVR